MTVDEMLHGCETAAGKPLQRDLVRLGFRREKGTGGPLWKVVLSHVADRATSAEHTPTGWEVEPLVILTKRHFRRLETELGRRLCLSSDVVFGSLQICSFELDETGKELDYLQSLFAKGAIDLRNLPI